MSGLELCERHSNHKAVHSHSEFFQSRNFARWSE